MCLHVAWALFLHEEAQWHAVPLRYALPRVSPKDARISRMRIIEKEQVEVALTRELVCYYSSGLARLDGMKRQNWLFRRKIITHGR